MKRWDTTVPDDAPGSVDSIIKMLDLIGIEHGGCLISGDDFLNFLEDEEKVKRAISILKNKAFL
jgi:hypothetical protein